MKIISPVDNLAECGALIAAGADELYGGYVTPAWEATFSLLTSLNQRTFATAQISSRDELVGIIDQAHTAGIRFNLTLNAPFYTDEQIPYLLDYVADAVSTGIDGLILADLSLLRSVRKRFPEVELQASTLAHIGNSLSARVYASAGLSRMILPRHIPVNEIADIVQSCPDIEFDVFMLVGKCPNTEGLCTFHHSSPDRVWPCEIPYDIEPMREDVPEAFARIIANQSSWSLTDRRHGCGLCAVPALQQAGIHGVKLVGRGAPGRQKIKNIQLAKDFIKLAAAAEDFGSYRKKAMAAHHDRFGSPCSPNVCYYPEYYLPD